MLEGRDWQSISKIIYQLYRHPHGLTLKEITRLTEQTPEVTANYLVMLDQMGAYVGLYCEDDEWDGEDDYIDYLIRSPQRWFITNDTEARFPDELNVEELTVLAQLSHSAGLDEIVAKISSALGQQPDIANLPPSLGRCMDRNWNSIAKALQEDRTVFVTVCSGQSKPRRKRVIPLALVHNRDSGFWYLIFNWRKSVHQLRLDKLDIVEIGKPVEAGLPEFDLKQYVGNSWGLMRGREEKVEAIFKDEGRVLAKAYARIKDRPTASWTRFKDARQLYCDTVAGVEEMLPWFRAFGSSVEVKRPKWVRELLLAEARQVIGFYSLGGIQEDRLRDDS